jgi:hypothetical protein
MHARKCTTDQLWEALRIVNEKYNGNIKFYGDPIRDPKGLWFRLRSDNAQESGAAASGSGKKTGSGCWHVHGDFFDTLFKINPEAIVYSGMRNYDGNALKITKDEGNWEDRNVGSNNDPCNASDACDCNFSQELTGKLATRAEILDAIRSKDIYDLLNNFGYKYGKLILETHKNTIKNMTAEQIEKLIGNRVQAQNNINNAELILKYCAKNILPLYIGKGYSIVDKRLKSARS